MTDIPAAHDRVLAIHPTGRGFGWALFEAPDTLLDWGLVHTANHKSGRLVEQLKRILSRYQPSALVLEEYAGDASKRTDRIQALNRSFEQAAGEHGVSLAVYDRELVASVLGVPSRASRYDVACAVAARIEDLSHRMPPKRKFGSSEDARQSLFAAAALALTRYAVLGLD
jgi:hypothetical protein